MKVRLKLKMRYLGGKVQISGWIKSNVEKLKEDRTIYIEPFLGGGGTFVKNSLLFKECFASDVHPDLIMLWRAVCNGWNPPDFISKEEWEHLKAEKSSALRGFAGFCCSYSGNWFSGYVYEAGNGGISRPFPVAAREVLIRDSVIVKRATLGCCSYDDWLIDQPYDTVVYCDPPYENTAGYKGTPTFDHDRFWKWATIQSEMGILVIVSEAICPDDWRCVASRVRATKVGNFNQAPRVESIFIHESKV